LDPLIHLFLFVIGSRSPISKQPELEADRSPLVTRLRVIGFTPTLLHSPTWRAQRNPRFNQTQISMSLSSIKGNEKQSRPCTHSESIWRNGGITPFMYNPHTTRFMGSIEFRTLRSIYPENVSPTTPLSEWSTLLVAQWLRHCATNRKAARSIPDYVIGIFH
jgi:hypothetical protein